MLIPARDLVKRHERTIHAGLYTDAGPQNHLRHSPDFASSASSEIETDTFDGQPEPTVPDRELPGSTHSRTAGEGRKQPQRESVQANLTAGYTGSSPLMQGASLFDAHHLAGPSFLHPGGQDASLGSDSLFLELLTGGTPGPIAHAPPTERSIGEQRDGPGDSRSAIWSDGASGAMLDNFDLNSINLQMDIGQSPVYAWSKNPDNLTLHLPVILREQPAPSPKNIIDEAGFECLHYDACVRLGLSGSPIFHVKELQQFINSYINSFHHHLPFIHLPSFSPINTFNTPSPLALAMASIGALYRLKRRRAHELYTLTEKMVRVLKYTHSDLP